MLALISKEREMKFRGTTILFICVLFLGVILACNGVVTPTPTAMPIPTITPVPIPVIYKQGTLSMGFPDNTLADLDNGTFIPWGTTHGGDLYYTRVSPTEKYFQPMQNTLLAVAGHSEPDYGVCKSLLIALGTKINLNDLKAGSYLCVYTDEKRISSLRITSIDTSSKGMIQFIYTTWGVK
jgi:hypothetical protein